METIHSSVEEKIINATIDCIEKYGFSGATNRRIAQAADVNIAAINYYFRSKEILIQRVMEITLRNAFDLSTMEPIPGDSAQERCLNVMLHIAQGGLNYPGLTRAHFYNLLAEGKQDALLVEHANRFIDYLAADMLDHGCALAQDELKLALIQIFSAVITGILAPTLFAQQHGLRLDQPEACRSYLTRLVDRLLR
jgi:AcrR family transcriptional regulator